MVLGSCFLNYGFSAKPAVKSRARLQHSCRASHSCGRRGISGGYHGGSASQTGHLGLSNILKAMSLLDRLAICFFWWHNTTFCMYIYIHIFTCIYIYIDINTMRVFIYMFGYVWIISPPLSHSSWGMDWNHHLAEFAHLLWHLILPNSALLYLFARDCRMIGLPYYFKPNRNLIMADVKEHGESS